MALQDKIQSIRETMAGGYRKPDPAQVDILISNLQESHDAREYLIKRGLTNTTIDHFKLGYDVAKNAISIPVYKHGELVNIRYRAISPDAKQRYTQEKGCEVWLYNDDGISKGIEKGRVLIVEGEFDLMSVWQTGVTNVISPASGKDSFGVWIELLDAIQQVYIAYDNDKPGKTAGADIANRVGTDKCFEVTYPEGIKDANEFFMSNDKAAFKKLIDAAQPYYKHEFSGVGDVITMLRENKSVYTEFHFVPYVKFESDWVAVLSGRSNSGKTTWALNIANEAVSMGLPTLFLPFERGIRSVGQRFLQVRYNKQQDDFVVMEDSEWEKLVEDVVELPMYMSMPTPDDFANRVRRARRLFGIRLCVIDHLDYFIRGDDKVSKQADMIREIKELAQELQIIFLVVHHIRKANASAVKMPPTMEELSGSSDTFKIAEVVGLLYKREEGEIDVIIDKNKGPQGTRTYSVNMATGKFEKGEYNNPNAHAKSGYEW